MFDSGLKFKILNYCQIWDFKLLSNINKENLFSVILWVVLLLKTTSPVWCWWAICKEKNVSFPSDLIQDSWWNQQPANVGLICCVIWFFYLTFYCHFENWNQQQLHGNLDQPWKKDKRYQSEHHMANTVTQIDLKQCSLNVPNHIAGLSFLAFYSSRRMAHNAWAGFSFFTLAHFG